MIVDDFSGMLSSDASDRIAVPVAAACLDGLTLPGGWRVVQTIQRRAKPEAHCYRVDRYGQAGFLKAPNFYRAFEGGKNKKAIFDSLMAAYEHECAILRICAERQI